MSYFPPSDFQKISELEDEQNKIRDILFFKSNSAVGQSNLFGQGRKSNEVGPNLGGKSWFPMERSVTDVDEAGVSTGVFDKLDLNALTMVVDAAVSTIPLKFVQFIGNGKIFSLTPKAGKTLEIQTGGDFDIPSIVTITDKQTGLFQKFDDTGKIKCISVPGGAGGSDTPWTVPHDAAGFNLDNLGNVNLNDTKILTFEDSTSVAATIDKLGSSWFEYRSADGFLFDLLTMTIPEVRFESGTDTDGLLALYVSFHAESDVASTNREYANYKIEVEDSQNTLEDGSWRLALIEAGVPDVAYFKADALAGRNQFFKTLELIGTGVGIEMGNDDITELKDLLPNSDGNSNIGAVDNRIGAIYAQAYRIPVTITDTTTRIISNGSGIEYLCLLNDFHEWKVDGTTEFIVDASGIIVGAVGAGQRIQGTTGVLRVILGSGDQFFVQDVSDVFVAQDGIIAAIAQPLGAGQFSDGTRPAASAQQNGALIWNTTDDLLQYTDGTNWRNVHDNAIN